jgi:hypothetical protein
MTICKKNSFFVKLKVYKFNIRKIENKIIIGIKVLYIGNYVGLSE